MREFQLVRALGFVVGGLLLAAAALSAQAPTGGASAQRPASQASGPALPAGDVSAAQINTFIDNLPKDAISDLPIKVFDTGGTRVGVYGVFRPKGSKQDAILHETTTSETYVMLEGAATLVTGGTIPSSRVERGSVRGDSIDGGVSRRVTKGDVIVIPGRTPHWFSNLETDLRYMIIRSDPQGRLQLK